MLEMYLALKISVAITIDQNLLAFNDGISTSTKNIKLGTEKYKMRQWQYYSFYRIVQK